MLRPRDAALAVLDSLAQEIAVFRIDGDTLTQTGRIPVEAPPVSMRPSW